MAITNEKSEVRRLIREKRALIKESQKKAWDEAVFQKLTAHPLIAGGDCVYCYMSMGGETGTGELLEWLWKNGKAAAVPRVWEREMDFFVVRSMEDLAPGCMGILEPVKHCPLADRPAAPVVVPGVAFAPEGERYGYGGGYYDRFFKNESRHHRIGIAYDFQVLPRLKQELYDQKVDEIITPDHHYICNAPALGPAAAFSKEELL